MKLCIYIKFESGIFLGRRRILCRLSEDKLENYRTEGKLNSKLLLKEKTKIQAFANQHQG